MSDRHQILQYLHVQGLLLLIKLILNNHEPNMSIEMFDDSNILCVQEE